ncbi:putative E3 ubiquitin-protein ligase ubr7 [Dissophora globulifera]|uniref:E3 ubiquitin-protein ligase ubr7 n=1 Tax=Dissophora globulifera TaxID=979702 RepID=A0A9P6UY92_9FUNG|nr:putative E3 ubiquitin-protein ligase ubr7 [Dissophora globulifera]
MQCTNSLGYLRQKVYACLTCNPNPSQEAGICYSCSISCHGEHNLVELFTKRHFRCDCGTDKFKDTPCKLDPKTAGSVNALNQYNHNYLGRFCWCDIQYDPIKEESTMLQCVVCEDWFHDTCIGITPHNDDFDDFICRTCTRDHTFLRRYAQNSLFMIGLSKQGDGPKSVTMVDCSKMDDKDVKGKSIDKGDDTSSATQELNKAEEQIDIVTIAESTAAVTATVTTTTTSTISTTTTSNSSEKRSLSTTVDTIEDVDGDDSGRNKRFKQDLDACKLQLQPDDAYPDQEMNLFATEGWRDQLCQCVDCMALYTKEGVLFILGEEPVFEDEEDDDAETSILESGMKRLSEMNRVDAMDGMLAYNTMRDELRTFLAPFVEQGKVVTAEDIQEFFAVRES